MYNYSVTLSKASSVRSAAALIAVGSAFLFAMFFAYPALGQGTAGVELDSPKPGSEQFMGEITAIRKAVLSTNVSGRLTKIPYFVGDYVKLATPMASLDTRDFEIVVKQAKAAVDASAARLRQLETGSRPEEKKQADEQLRQAEATSKTAISDYVRMKELFASNMISKQTMEATEAKATVSDAQCASAKLQKAIIDQGPRVEEKENMRALIRQQEASLELAMIQLEYATLKAPFDGIVSARHSNEGAFVNPSSPIYTLQQIDPIYASVDCPEKYLSLLQKGTRAVITIDALPGKKFSGVLERTPAVIDTITRTAKAEFTIENPDKLLRPGMFVRATISFEAKIGGANERF